MEQQQLMGEKVGFHVDPWWDRPDPCWGECSYCAEGQYRYEDEAVAEKALALVKKWSRICADGVASDISS